MRSKPLAPSRIVTAWFWIIVAALLAVPVQFGLSYLHHGKFVWSGLLASLGLAGLLLASSALMSRARRSWAVVAGVIAMALFFLRMFFFGLTRFSGRAFDAGFFLSMSKESAGMAWHEYSYLFVLFGVGALALLTAFVTCSRRLQAPSTKLAAALALASLVAIGIGHRTEPAWQLASAIHAWYAPKNLDLPAARMAMWRQSPLIHVDLVPKQALRAQAATPPKNLIMLYIESGGVAMAPAKKYPGLMPNMERLIARDGFVPHIHASSYITIEGLVNTQCGTLFPFTEDSNTMAGFDHLLEQMPCLGDVLAKAGYRQIFYFGNGKSFAGTGKFLAVHGFNKVMGIADWQKLGLQQRPDTWGIADPDLFRESIPELKRLQASGHPYNFTMFTIGTHVPGFFYNECQHWGDGSKRFLDAVHCTDQLIQRWIDALKSNGILDKNTILVMTGDHQIFPNPHMVELFGADAVSDHRLPFIVIGHDLPRPVLHDGAGYDIAPTVLDLLGIQSNARFALGRSLLRDDRKLDYYPSRFIDMLGENRYHAGKGFNCDPANTTRIPGAQPLSQCERRELFTILAAQASEYSAPLPQMRCSALKPLRVKVPVNVGAPLRMAVTDNEQAGRFTWNERQVPAGDPGLYLLTLDKQGTLVDRRYAPPAEVASHFAEQPKLSGAVLVVVWRPDPLQPVAALPDWLQRLGVDDRGGAWVFGLHAASAPVLREHTPLGQTLKVTPQACTALLAAP